MSYAFSISDLKPDDKVQIFGQGNLEENRDPFIMDTTFFWFDTVDGHKEAVFSGFRAYKDKGRWRYGEHGDLVSILVIRYDMR